MVDELSIAVAMPEGFDEIEVGIRELDGNETKRASLRSVRTDDLNDESSTSMLGVEEDASSFGFNDSVQSLPNESKK